MAVALRAGVASVGASVCTVPQGMIGILAPSLSRSSSVAPSPLRRSLAMNVSFGTGRLAGYTEVELRVLRSGAVATC
jgi:hypothetical protein